VTKPALLDVNVLVALFDPDHIQHDAAHEWFGRHRQDGWATCPLTELSLVRTLSNPSYWSGAERSADVVERLRQFRASGDHQFWRDSLELTDEIFYFALLKGHRQLTDVYLLALAVRRSGRLATFDPTIPVAAVSGAANDALFVIGQ
jgi:toxin-antitoxin system PIN domain toxin